MHIGIKTVLRISTFILSVLLLVFLLPSFSEARNILRYSDTISDSNPTSYSNHTMRFTPQREIPAGGVIEVQFPGDFFVSTSTEFSERNVELRVDGIPRLSASTTGIGVDAVSLVRGDGGSIRYELNSSVGISADSEVELLIGNHTSGSQGPYMEVSTTTGTTTYSGDIKPIRNSESIGTHSIDISIQGAIEPMYASFLIGLVPSVYVGDADTRETIPPFRFDPAPTSTVGGTTAYVEISLRTDEFAWCRYSMTPDVAFQSMTNLFENTGLVLHSTVVAVTRGTLNVFYVRCIDDENNINTDDFQIAFVVNEQPTGESNVDGDVEGDGTGSGNDGSGDGSGSGGTSGEFDGEADTTGGSTGGGGSGGGGGGRSGDKNDGETGGGFESSDGPYPSGDAEVIISGYAFPGSTVYAIVDGSAGGNAKASSDGRYSLTISDIAKGAYTFGVYAIDRNQTKSSTFSTSFTVTGGRTSSLSNINLAPSIKVTPDPVNPGQTLTVSGYALPEATVTIENQKDGSSASKKEYTATANKDGFWQLTVDTNAFSQGTYKIRAKSVAGSLSTNYSNYTFYGVGQKAAVGSSADLNVDGKVNLTDFSILLFWWGRDGGNSNPPADINSDGTVSLTDFSIMLFNWTG